MKYRDNLYTIRTTTTTTKPTFSIIINSTNFFFVYLRDTKYTYNANNNNKQNMKNQTL